MKRVSEYFYDICIQEISLTNRIQVQAEQHDPVCAQMILI